MRVLVLDVGGSNVKLLATGQGEPRKFPSGPDFTPERLVVGVREHAAGWGYDVIALGLPGPVGPGGAIREPGNLGGGWVGYDFEAAFGVPVRVVNDAAMQALGGYRGGRMLFLGLGTGLGSALVADRVVVPLELGVLGRDRGRELGRRLGKKGLAEHGWEKWNQRVAAAVAVLKEAFGADEVLLGGGNAKKVDPVPDGCRVGGNDDAFAGGFRLWEQYEEPHDAPRSPTWRVVP